MIDDLDAGDEVTVFYGSEKFAPVQYHVFEVGPFIAKTKVRPGETGEQAGLRAYKVLEAVARKTYAQKRDEYLSRIEDANRETLRRAKANRGT